MCEIFSRKDIPSLTQRKGKSDALRRFFPLFLCFSKRFSLRFGRRILSSRAALSASLARVLASIFVSYYQNLLDMTTTAMRIYSISFIFMGVNIFLVLHRPQQRARLCNRIVCKNARVSNRCGYASSDGVRTQRNLGSHHRCRRNGVCA